MWESAKQFTLDVQNDVVMSTLGSLELGKSRISVCALNVLDMHVSENYSALPRS